MKDKKILMVDDDLEELMLIEEALIELGKEIHFEENGIEALSYLDQCEQLPCLIVLDLNMPKLNGVETLVQLKADVRFRDITVVIYSTSINDVEKDKCLKLGAHCHLMKPISYATTISTAKLLSDLCQANKDIKKEQIET